MFSRDQQLHYLSQNNNKVLDEINVDFNSGLSNIFEKLNQLDNVRREKLIRGTIKI